MALIKITSHTDSFTVELNDAPADRKKARIKFAEIRSLTQNKQNENVQFIFTNGEIAEFPPAAIDEIDGDTNIDTQDILYDKLEAKIFA